MNQMDEKLVTNMQENITNGLKEGTIKMGNIIPFTYYHGSFSVGETMSHTFSQLIITPNYKEDIRKHYEEMVKT